MYDIDLKRIRHLYLYLLVKIINSSPVVQLKSIFDKPVCYLLKAVSQDSTCINMLNLNLLCRVNIMLLQVYC